MVDKKRTAMAVQTLKYAYPKARIILRYSTPWELLVAVMLSAQCTDVTVNKVTQKLFAKYKTLDAYARADRTGFEQDIKSTGFYRAKAKNVLAAAKLIKTKILSKKTIGIQTFNLFILYPPIF